MDVSGGADDHGAIRPPTVPGHSRASKRLAPRSRMFGARRCTQRNTHAVLRFGHPLFLIPDPCSRIDQHARAQGLHVKGPSPTWALGGVPQIGVFLTFVERDDFRNSRVPATRPALGRSGLAGHAPACHPSAPHVARGAPSGATREGAWRKPRRSLMFAPARRFVTASVLSVPSWRSRDEWGAIHAAPPTGGAAPLTHALERPSIALARSFARYRQLLRIVIGGARSRRAAGREHARRLRWSVLGPIVLSRAENGERAPALI